VIGFGENLKSQFGISSHRSLWRGNFAALHFLFNPERGNTLERASFAFFKQTFFSEKIVEAGTQVWIGAIQFSSGSFDFFDGLHV
jgi:hypothetical protein